MKRTLWLALLLAVTGIVSAQEAVRRVKCKEYPSYIYRVALSDKQGTRYTLDQPGRYLSRKAVERRRRQRLAVDSTDLPVNDRYVRLLVRKGISVVGTSRWHNTVLVKLSDTTLVSELRRLPCVRSCRCVWTAPDSITPTALKTKYHDAFNPWDSVPGQVYGGATEQIQMLKGERLHELGLLGRGITIAVLDGGFRNVDRIPAFSGVDIEGVVDFVSPPSPSVFAETDHGTKVLSAMALRTPYYYVGTAPEATYWLLRCEDQQTEQEVEEDYWTMAAEFADSVGVDIINSSLGYNEFDHRLGNHRLWQLDGRTAFISQSASLLARKGIVLVCSAGNAGMTAWKKITFPADADDCLTIGAVTAERTNAPFSSIGPTQDGRVKPDLMALGSPAVVVSGRGTVIRDMGTSFAAPVACGLVACLWQSMRHLTATQLMELIRQTGDNLGHPDNICGYGVPNFWRAYMIGKAKKEE